MERTEKTTNNQRSERLDRSHMVIADNHTSWLVYNKQMFAHVTHPWDRTSIGVPVNTGKKIDVVNIEVERYLGSR